MKRGLNRPLPAWSAILLVMGTAVIGIVASAGGDQIGLGIEVGGVDTEEFRDLGAHGH